MPTQTVPDKFQFTKDESGEIKYYDMRGNPIAPPPSDTMVRVIDHDPRILPMQHKTQGNSGLNAMNNLTRNRVFIR